MKHDFKNKRNKELQRVRKKYFRKRCEFACTVCELLGWTTPAGRPKKIQCAAFLEKLEAEGIIQLPPTYLTKQNNRGVHARKEYKFDTKERKLDVCNFQHLPGLWKNVTNGLVGQRKIGKLGST